MKFPRWLTALFPRLAPQGQWSDAVPVTDQQRLVELDTIYEETVLWILARRPDAAIAPIRRVALRVWPQSLRAPDGLGIAKVLAPGVIPSDTNGTLLIKERWQDSKDIIAHECKHCITGEPGHPPWLFPTP